MKTTRFLSLMLALLLVAGISFAGPTEDEKLFGNSAVFSKLHSVAYISLATGTTLAMTPTDNTSTNTTPVSYLPAGITYPCQMVITNSSTTQVLWARPYEKTTAGVLVPTATCAALPWDSNIQYKKVFTGKPNLSITPSAGTSVRVEFWTQP